MGGKKYFKEPFEDLSSFKGSEEEKMELFRNLRDKLGDWVQDLFNYKINKTSGENRQK